MPSSRSNRPKRHLPFRGKLVLALVLMSLAMALYTGIFSLRLATEQVTNISIRLSENRTASANAALSGRLDELHEQTNQLIFSDPLRELAALERPTTSDRAAYGIRISSAVLALMTNAEAADVSFESVSIFLKNGYTNTPRSAGGLPFSDYAGCIDYFAAAGVPISGDGYTGPLWALCPAEGGERQTLVYLRFLHSDVTLDKTGLIVFGVREDWLRGVYGSYAAGSLIMSADGVVLSSADKAVLPGSRYAQADLLLRSIADSAGSTATVTYPDSSGQRQIISFAPVTSVGGAWLIVPFDYHAAIRGREMADYLRSVLLLGAAGMLVSVGVALLLARSLSRSVSELTAFTRRVEAGQTDLRYEARGHDEIAYLGRRINEMLDHLQRSARQREAGLLANQALQTQLMQLQSNPHLLYNTLDSVLWVLQEQRLDDATTLISSLSEFFKLSLSHGREQIPLSDELTLVRHYLTIQRLARQKDIRMVYDIDEALYPCPIIKLTIQPLVENAIVHGFAGYRNDGAITIRAVRTGGQLEISVTDNGIGMLEEEVAELNRILALPALPADFPHFGLFNINRRIVQTYGEAYGLTISSELSEYTSIRMRLPCALPDPEKEEPIPCST